jgi:hypothetical protein
MVPRSVAVSGCANSKADEMKKSKNPLNRRTMLASLWVPLRVPVRRAARSIDPRHDGILGSRAELNVF